MKINDKDVNHLIWHGNVFTVAGESGSDFPKYYKFAKLPDKNTHWYNLTVDIKNNIVPEIQYSSVTHGNEVTGVTNTIIEPILIRGKLIIVNNVKKFNNEEFALINCTISSTSNGYTYTVGCAVWVKTSDLGGGAPANLLDY